MSGINLHEISAGGVPQNLNAMPSRNQKTIVRDYCKKRPHARYMEAVAYLYAQFPAEAPGRNASN